MKNAFKLLLLAAIVVESGCLSNKNSSDPVPVPTGTFSGQFRKVHKKSTGVYDTLKATIQLKTTTAGLFKVSGDTTTLHAGSHGSFQLNSVYVQFQDSTATAAKQPKVHLNGVYQYYYDGSAFQFIASNDTLSYQYDLKKN